MTRLVLVLLLVPFAPFAPAGEAIQIADGVLLFEGQAGPGRQPDGNSVVLATGSGLVIVDTGRHLDHTQRLLDHARAQRQPVLAIINTHWHLDHIGGNARLRDAFPGVTVHASPALAGALDGFLAEYRSHLEAAIPRLAADPERQSQLRAELALLDQAEALAPDRVITASGVRAFGARELALNLETAAVTGGDVWLLDRASGTLIAGDLVTLPAPFLDTACPARWRAALERIVATDFIQLVPGHGPVMDRDEVRIYQAAFGNLLDCAASDHTREACTDGWFRDADALLADHDRAYARELLAYYFDNHLRGDPARQAALCVTD